MTFKLIIVPRAERDVQHVFDWIAQRSPEGAQRWYAAFEGAARKMLAHPAACALAPEDEEVDFDVRQFLFKTRRGQIYRGLFTIRGDEVFLLRVRGPGQPPLAADELE